MTFPVAFHLGPVTIPAHFVFESLAYFTGFRVYLGLRRRWGDPVAEDTRWTLIAAAALGAALGSKLLGWLDHPVEAWTHRTDLKWLLGGKTIVGGLLGGLIGVEIAKRAVGETRRTGDLFVIPLCAGMAIGRVGCFLAGLDDHTYGVATSLPWGVDFGDGVRRHPTQLYEIVGLLAIATWAWRARHRGVTTAAGDNAAPGGRLREGDLFRGFLGLYLLLRLVADGIKPEDRPYFGLSGIQVACVLGLLYYSRDLLRIFLGSGGSAGDRAPVNRSGPDPGERTHG